MRSSQSPLKESPLRTAVVIVAVLAVMLLAAGPARAASTADFLDSEFFVPHNSPITGQMVVNNWRWYGIDVLPQLVIMAAETSLGDPRLGGSLVQSNNFGCIRYRGTDSKWGELSNGRVWAAGKDWYSFPTPGLGMMGFGRYLKVGLDGFYLRVLDGPSYDWPAFAARYYGRNVAGYDRYVRNLYALDSRFRAKAIEAGFLW